MTEKNPPQGSCMTKTDPAGVGIGPAKTFPPKSATLVAISPTSAAPK